MKNNRITSREAWRIVEEINRLSWMLSTEELPEVMQEEFAADLEKWKLVLEESGYQAVWNEQTNWYALSKQQRSMQLAYPLSDLPIAEQETDSELVTVSKIDQAGRTLSAVIGATIRFRHTDVETCVSYMRTDSKQVDFTLIHATETHPATFCIGIARTVHNPALHFAYYAEFSLEETRLLCDLLEHPEVKRRLRREER